MLKAVHTRRRLVLAKHPLVEPKPLCAYEGAGFTISEARKGQHSYPAHKKI
eukprot:SAG11_NODE_10517_length_825_cov_1.038567_1_plen_50_part_01